MCAPAKGARALGRLELLMQPTKGAALVTILEEELPVLAEERDELGKALAAGRSSSSSEAGDSGSREERGARCREERSRVDDDAEEAAAAVAAAAGRILLPITS